MSILIVADDLTGAADCAVQFRQAGLSAVVLTTPPRRPSVFSRFQVVSLSLHTRDASVMGVRRVWQRHAPTVAKLAEGALIYQKIDSTLRGHAALEVQLLLDCLAIPAAVIAPAFPMQGRQTLDGIHQVHGVPLVETEYARTHTVTHASSHLGEIFASAGGPAPAHLSLHVIERGAETVAGWLRDRLAEARRLITADAVHEGHFDILTQAVLSLDKRLLLVGSAGWAARLALVCKGATTSAQLQPGVLGVVGSLNGMATRQVRTALDTGVMVVRCSPTLPGSTSYATEAEWRALTQALVDGQHAVVWTHPSDASSASYRAGQRVLRRLGGIVREILASTAASGMVVVGGDTTHAIFRALHSSGVRLAGEVASGIPYGRLLDGPFSGLPTVTKAGGFGADATLRECLDFLQGWAAQ